MKPIRLDEETELRLIKKAAKRAGLPWSTWLRDRGVNQAKRELKE